MPKQKENKDILKIILKEMLSRDYVSYIQRLLKSLIVVTLSLVCYDFGRIVGSELLTFIGFVVLVYFVAINLKKSKE